MLYKFGRLGERVTIRFEPAKVIVGKDGNTMLVRDDETGTLYTFDLEPFLHWVKHREYTCPFAAFLKFEVTPPTMVVHMAHWGTETSKWGGWKTSRNVIATSFEAARIEGKETSVTILLFAR